MKKLFLRGLLLCSAFFLFNCQNEDITEESHQEQLDIAIERKSFNEFQKLPKLVNKHLRDSQAGLNKNSNPDPLYDFEIDSTSVTQISYQGITYYTMAIVRQGPFDRNFENLVVIDGDTLSKAYLLKYFPSDEYLVNSQADGHIPFVGNVNIIEISPSVLANRGATIETCVTYTQVMCNEKEATHVPYDKCTGVGFFFQTTTMCVTAPAEYPTLVDEGGNSGSLGGGSGTGPGNTGTNPGVQGPIRNPVVTEPVKPIVYVPNSFFSQLTALEKEWWNRQQNASIVQAINNFLNANKVNGIVRAEAMKFANQALDALMQGGDVDFIYKVIVDKSFKDNPCLMGVYEQLGEAETFQNYLKNFDGDFSVAHLKLSAGDVGSHAITSPPENFLIEIKFDVAILSTVPSLDVAGTFIHEMIHAEIFRKMMIAAQNGSLDPASMTTQQQINYVNNLKNNFSGIYDYYVNRYHPNWTHQMMAQHYINIIIQVLKQYDNTQSSEVYEAIAWGGLMGQGIINSTTGLPLNPTVAWQNIPQTQRLQILNTYNNFKNNNPPCQ